MDIYENAEQLKTIPLLSGADKAQLKLLAFTSEAIDFAPGEYLFRINTPSDSVYVILSGQADVIRDDNPEHPQKLASIGENTVLGEMGVFLNTPRYASIRANTQVRTLRIPASRFIKLVTGNPKIALEVMRDLSKKIKFTSELAINSKNELDQLREGDQ